MVWGTYAVKIEVKNGHLLVLRRVLRLARMLCALRFRQNGDLANLLKSSRKQSAPECLFECGGGGDAKAIRAMPKCLQHEFEWGFPESVTRSVHSEAKHISS